MRLATLLKKHSQCLGLPLHISTPFMNSGFNTECTYNDDDDDEVGGDDGHEQF